MGECGKEQSFAILDAFYNLGGNFLDTLVACHVCVWFWLIVYRANNYQNEQSEIWLGEWMKERGNRDQLVYAINLKPKALRHLRLQVTDHTASQPNTQPASAPPTAPRNQSNPT